MQFEPGHTLYHLDSVVTIIERHHILPDSQFGFRRGRRTADILAALQYRWVHALGYGGCAQVLAMDLAGDFDLVSHIGLLQYPDNEISFRASHCILMEPLSLKRTISNCEV